MSMYHPNFKGFENISIPFDENFTGPAKNAS
jgi:hypothetical protein